MNLFTADIEPAAPQFPKIDPEQVQDILGYIMSHEAAAESESIQQDIVMCFVEMRLKSQHSIHGYSPGKGLLTKIIDFQFLVSYENMETFLPLYGRNKPLIKYKISKKGNS